MYTENTSGELLLKCQYSVRLFESYKMKMDENFGKKVLDISQPFPILSHTFRNA